MRCHKCNSERLKAPPERGALEIFVCLDCGEENAVHCLYPFPHPPAPAHILFSGRYVLAEASATKCYLKLKKNLLGCERFNAAKLEEQFLAKKTVWDLGEFFDYEVERLKAECREIASRIEFTQI